MMRLAILVLTLGFVGAGSARGGTPLLSAGGGGMNVLATERVVVWSEAPNLRGLLVSSEIIDTFALESEVANDFTLPNDATITTARWWGGYFNNLSCTDIGYGAFWNLRFYDDGGCVPGRLIAEYPLVAAHEFSIECEYDIYPLFQYEASVQLAIAGGAVYWFGAQCGDHAFPPQVGRLASAGIVDCESVFKGAYFSYPDWTPTVNVLGEHVDFSQEFEGSGTVPVRATTWGAVKDLYRR